MSKTVLPEIVQNALETTLGLGEKDGKHWAKVAHEIGVTQGTLRNKIARDSGEKRHHITLSEALAIVKVTNDYSIIHAICTFFHGEFLAHPGLDEVSNEELLNRYTCMMKELGQFSTDIHQSLLDGVITKNEIEGLQKDFLRLTGALSGMMDRLQEKADHDAQIQKLGAIMLLDDVRVGL